VTRQDVRSLSGDWTLSDGTAGIEPLPNDLYVYRPSQLRYFGWNPTTKLPLAQVAENMVASVAFQ